MPSETSRNDQAIGRTAATRCIKQVFTDTHASALNTYSYLNEMSLKGKVFKAARE